MAHMTIADIKARKNSVQPLVCLTAYTAPMAKLLDNHADLLLVGDSVGMVLYGMDNTLDVTLEMMIAHGQAVMRSARKACIIVDMPFGTYEESPQQAHRNAAKIMSETGCDGIKLEGGQDMAETIAYLTSHGIPVMGHIGLQPQSVLKDGGYKIKGRTTAQEARLMANARAVEAAGAFSFVIEGTLEDVSAQITKAVSIPTIGIGASKSCDGQILVTEDMLGLLDMHTPKFVKQYAHISEDIERAAQQYAAEVRARIFPDERYIYARPPTLKTDPKPEQVREPELQKAS